MSVRYILALAFILLAAIAGLSKWRLLTLPDKVIAVLLWATVVQEGLALLLDILHGNNMPTYHFYSMFELGAWTTYFALSNRDPIRLTAALLGIVGVAFSVANSVWIQNPLTPNTYFWLFEASIILVISIVMLYRIILDEKLKPFELFQFWIVLLLLLYWSVTFSSYGMMGLLATDMQLKTAAISTLQVANILFYAAVSILFFRYAKMIPTCARR